jgi:glycosyltransferase involved in cell wall biosynthesis
VPVRERILFVVEALASGVLGIVSDLASEAAAIGLEVGVLYGQRPETPADVRSAFADDLFAFERVWFGRGVASQARAITAVERAIRTYSPSIVHAHSSFAGLAAAMTTGRERTIYTPHAYGFLRTDVSPAVRTLNRALERFVAQRIGLIVGCSEAESQVARDELHAPRVRTVRNGISDLDHVSYSPPALGTRRTVAAAGRIGPQRRPAGTARILDAVRDLADITWIGDAPDGSSHRSELIRRSVPITGWIERERVRERLRVATIYLHWTAWDGLPLAVLEAMAMGSVVVASDIPPNREILGDAFVQDTEAGAVELIRRLLADREMLDRARADQAHRGTLFGANRMRREWSETYESRLRHGGTLSTKAVGS